MKQMASVLVGLTGQSGAGKSTVSAILAERGYPVVDADEVSRNVVEKGSRCLADLVLEFGAEILDAGGGLDRRRMGGLVFGDDRRRQRFNQLVFPHILEAIDCRIAALTRGGEPAVFLDAPTLFESGYNEKCDKVVSVVAPVELRLQRLLARDSHRSREELVNRMRAQHEDDFYTARSHFTIRNDGDFAGLGKQVEKMLHVCLTARGRGATEVDA